MKFKGRRDAKRGPVRRRDRGEQRLRNRLVVLMCVVSALLVGVLGRVVVLQTVSADDYREASMNQRLTTERLRAGRGTIFDRHGVELALSVPSTTVFADPRLVQNAAATAQSLGLLLGWTPERIDDMTQRLGSDTSHFAYVERQVSGDLADAVMALSLPGVATYQEPQRVVTGGDLARSILGRTDPDGVGISGVELLHDLDLTGSDGTVQRELDGSGRSLPTGRRTVVAPRPGDDLVLTLDRSIQFQVEQALVRRVNDLSARRGTAIVMDSRTGALLAIGSVERRPGESARVTAANLTAVSAHEPGSVAKVITTAAALNDDRVRPETVFEVPGVIMVDNFKITDAFPHGTEPTTVSQILTQSSNIGTILISEELGVRRQYEYLRAFGFGERTHAQFPGESAGILKSYDQWRGTERFTASYGYGFAATSLQLAAAVNVIANGGVYVAPRLVHGVVNGAGDLNELPPAPTRSVLRPAVANTMTTMMTDAVCRGTAKLAQIPGVSVAGKTGTGYKVQDNGTYVDNFGRRSYFASFVGFLPAQNPQVTILVSIDEPDPSTRDRFGGTAAAPVFAEIAQVVLHELEIEPPANDRGCEAAS